MLLEEYRKVYENAANLLNSDWKHLSKSDCCYKYLEVKDIDSYLSNLYLSALIYKVLPKVISYRSKYYNVLLEEDCYDVMIRSILYVLDKKIWCDKSSSLYKVKDAPEIAINMRMKTQFLNEGCAKSRQKRKVNTESVSLDSLEETFLEGYFSRHEDSNIEESVYLKDKIHEVCENDCFNGLLLDCIVSENVFTGSKKFSLGKVKKALKNIDNSYCSLFAHKYSININLIESQVNMIKADSDKELIKKINTSINKLKRDYDLYRFVKYAY